MLEEIEKYRAEFNEIVDTVYKAYRGQALDSYKPYLIVLYNTISQFDPIFPLERGDIHQELFFRWMIFIPKYYEARPAVKLRQYLIRRSIWAMRNWVRSLTKKTPMIQTQTVILPEFRSFVLNLKFLTQGTEVVPFDCLTAYERYLIFLKFKEDRTILEIARAVQKTRKTVKAQLKRVYDKLRSHADASTESRRSSQGSDGDSTQGDYT